MIIGELVTIKRVVMGTGLVIKNGEIVSVEKNFVKVFCYEDNKELKYDIKAFLKGIEEDNIIVSKEVMNELSRIVFIPSESKIGKLIVSPNSIVENKISNGFSAPLKMSYFTSYGTDTKKIYNKCCDLFDWDYKDVVHFGWQTPCFSELSTPEKYDVWMLTHNNWTETEGGKWVNEIHENGIVQWSIQKGYPAKRNRVVFAKTKKGHYLFLGLFLIDNIEEYDTDDGYTIYREMYIRVSKTYPEQ